MERGAGVLMHIASLPSEYGIGSFGREAYNFVDFLKKSGFKYWQILPLGHTSYGDSPYQCFSAFAGNPYFIDFDILKDEGLLFDWQYQHEDYGNNPSRIDYGKVYTSRYKVLKKVYSNYKNSSNKKISDEIEIFKKENEQWINDYALYMALKCKFNMKSWMDWDEDIKRRELSAIDRYKKILADDIEYWIFIQYLFFKQWKKLKEYVNKQGIKIIGDLPFYIATDSADTWSKSENFKIDKKTYKPMVVSGCPPDAFSKTGQLWGNLIYDWESIKKDNYKWWLSRVEESLNLYDVIRIDHFRGFESYWTVPYGDSTAENGKWEKGPGKEIFYVIESKLGKINIIAEDLGYLTDEVKKLLKDTGFPGMKVLQFAFSGSNTNYYLPHNYIRNCIAYTGTHDNDTFKGWYEKTGSREEVINAKKYLGLNNEEGYNFGFLRGVWSSIADIAIAPMQDFLNLGNDSRMNLPSSFGGNWSWRIRRNQLNGDISNKIYDLSHRYRRID